MIKQKFFDGVIEAVRYSQDGNIDKVRAYERRGYVFTDRLIIDRQSLLERLKEGARFYVGQRKSQYGNDFILGGVVQLKENNGSEAITSGESTSDHDHLKGVPIF